MQDFKTALHNALKQSQEKQMQQEKLFDTVNQWEKDEVSRIPPEPPIKHAYNITTNVSRVTFNHVRDNPGMTKQESTKILAGLGFSAASVDTLIGQMVRNGQAVLDANNGVSTHLKEYEPISNTKSKSKKNKASKAAIKSAATRTERQVNTHGIAALSVRDAPVLPKPVEEKGFDADKLLSTLSFADVLTLHKKIKVMLAGLGA